MKIVIDSGSTKADWLISNTNRAPLQIETIGFNTMLNNVESFKASFLNHKKKPATDNVTEVFYYGAGCSTQAAISLAKETIQSLFPQATIHIENDLIGAARAVSQNKPSVVAILGTGSNSCLFNGTKIIDQVSNLGYLLGDEGAGYAIGREILRSFFYRELPPELTIAFQDKYKLSRNQLVDKIYSSPTPNSIIASFAEFAVQYRSEESIKEIITDVFQEYITRNLLKYQITTSVPVHFIGSIAYMFQSKLAYLLTKNSLLPGRFLRKPIDGLGIYHGIKS